MNQQNLTHRKQPGLNPAAVMGANAHAEIFKQAIRKLEKKDTVGARKILENFPELSLENSNADVKSFIFLKALWKNVDPKEFSHSGNLYLQNFDSQQIDLFNLMSNKMPMVYFAVRLANDLLTSLILPHSEVVLIDVGIGTGQQIVKLLKHLKVMDHNPRSIHVVGIEPSESSLMRAQADIKAQSGFNFQVTFEPFLGSAENLNDSDWKKIKGLGKTIVINEAFAIHHVTSHLGAPDQKIAVLEKLRELEPVGFVLSEPHSNHQSEKLMTRFENAWKHFGLVFDVIDAQPLKKIERDAMKLNFFAREVEDILGTDEAIRSERHESAEMWVDRLKQAGFSIISCESIVQDLDDHTVSLTCKGDYLSLEHANETVVALITATS